MVLYVGNQKVSFAKVVNKNLVETEELNITPTTTPQEITVSGDIGGFNPVTVEAVTNSIDDNIIPKNIRKDVTILGVTGTLFSGEYPAVINEVTVSATTSEQTIKAGKGVDGFNPIVVEAVTSEIDSNITSDNIKKDVTILGVTGSVVELKGEVREELLTSVNESIFVPSNDKNGITSISITPNNEDLVIDSNGIFAGPNEGYSGFGRLEVNVGIEATDDNNGNVTVITGGGYAVEDDNSGNVTVG